MSTPADLAAKVTDAITEFQAAIGTAATRRWLIELANGLGAPEDDRGSDQPPAAPDPGENA